jgi:hypothetical protein
MWPLPVCESIRSAGLEVYEVAGLSSPMMLKNLTIWFWLARCWLESPAE